MLPKEAAMKQSHNLSLHTKREHSPKLLRVFFLLAAIALGFLLYHRASQSVICLSETEPSFYLEEDDPAFLEEAASNPFPSLSVPTQLIKISDTYFIVDCYHDQIIYSDSLEKPLDEWLVLTDEIDKGHTIAGDGSVYLADDTENNRILIFEKKKERFVHTQTFSDIGIRPHYIIYNEDDKTFYAWSSMTGEMYLFKREKDTSRVFLHKVLQLPALDGYYVRSFTIMGNDIYFVSGNSSIIRADLHSFRILEEYPVPDAIAGMVQLTLIDGYYYITVSTDKAGSQDAATIIRTRDLKDLASSAYEDVYAAFADDGTQSILPSADGSFAGAGTPYYITQFEGHYYLTEHRLPGHSIWSFDSENGILKNVRTLY